MRRAASSGASGASASTKKRRVLQPIVLSDSDDENEVAPQASDSPSATFPSRVPEEKEAQLGAGAKLTEVERLKRELEEARLEVDQFKAFADSAAVTETGAGARIKTAARYLRAEDEKHRKELKRQAEELEELRRSSTERINALEDERDEATRQLTNLRAATDIKIGELQHTKVELEHTAQSRSEEAESLRQQMDRMRLELAELRSEKDRANALEEKLNRTEQRLEAASGLSGASGMGASDATQRLLASYRDELQRARETEVAYRSLLAESSAMRTRTHRFAVLEEQVASLTKDAEKARSYRERVSDLEGELEHITSERDELARTLQGFVQLAATGVDGKQSGLFTQGNSSGGSASAQYSKGQMQDALQALRREREVLHNQAGSARTLELQATRELQEMKLALRQAETEQKRLSAKLQQVETALAREEKRCRFVTKQRDGLKAILTSYDEEDMALTTNIKAAADAARAAMEKGTDEDAEAQAKARLDAQAQAQVSSHAEMQLGRIAALEESLRVAEEEAAVLRQENQAIVRLEDEKGKLEKELVKCERQLALMESRLGKGEYDKSTTKVLHFSMNPAKAKAEERKVQKQQEEKELRAENLQLLAQVKQLQQAVASSGGGSTGGSGGAGMGAMFSMEAQKEVTRLQGEVAELKETLAKNNKQRDTYMRVFKQKSSAFRDACYELLGYRVDMVGGAPPTAAAGSRAASEQYVLRSVYAAHKDDALMFSKTPTGLHMMETPFCRKLDKSTVGLLTKFHSIPAFLAQVQLELFNDTTVATHMR